MARDTSFRDYILYDLMHDIPGISCRGMFGGFAFYKDGIIFGLLIGDKLHFKVNDTNRAAFEKYHSKPFSFAKKNGTTTLTSYWEVPSEIIDEHDELVQWLEKSVEASIQSKIRH